jgi:hypothetical protein
VYFHVEENQLDKLPEDRPTLDVPTGYEIVISGHLGDDWADWFEIEIVRRMSDDGSPETAMKGVFDQAALQGLLRRIHSFGFPLISVQWHGGFYEDS